MPARHKRGGRAVRVIALVAANLLLLAVLWRVFHTARADAVDAHSTGEPPASTDVASAPATLRPARARDAGLERRIRAAIEAAEREAERAAKGRVRAGQCAVAVHVREVGTDGELVAIEADRALRPASNLKLVTSAAALVLFGAEGRFETVFESAAGVVNGILEGDLVVHAGGDPLYDREAAGDVTRFLAPVAAALRDQGITLVGGALVLDEGTYQEPAPGPGWPDRNQHWQEHCALAGGFSANAGCLTANVEPGALGEKARVRLAPLGHGLQSNLSVRTAAARTPLDVRVGVSGGVARVEGSIPKDALAWAGRFAAPDPVLLFGNAALATLELHGVRSARGLVRERRPPASGARVLARITTPIVDVLGPINTWSNNACADQLFLTLGRWQVGQGTRAGGRAAVAFALERLGLDATGLVQVDGSGLSRENRVSARQITALLDAVVTGEPRAARAFRDSLAIGGESGTLDRRLASLEGRVHAKTGFIGGTSALSGLLETFDGRTLCFSILVEYPTVDGLNKTCWKPMQDTICEILAAPLRG